MSKKSFNKKLLFLVPAKSAKGGIVNYFNVLEGRFNLPVEYFVRGARNWPKRDGKLKEIFRAWNDLKSFRKRIQKEDISIVQSSTSLGSFAVIRDGLFLHVAKKRGIFTIAFFRGWDENFEKKLRGWKLFLFKKYYFKSNAFIVLSTKFEKKLRAWGYKGDIHIESTIVDENLLNTFNQKELQLKLGQLNLSSVRLLFLARTEKSKGLFEAINAFIILKETFPGLKLTVAGDGFAKEEAISVIHDHQLDHDVEFVGYVKGSEKAEVFKKSHIYLFPSYTEGMPNSVLEAMAFGLPIITTPVGGLTDFFKEGKNGYYVEIKNVNQIVHKAKELIRNPQFYEQISIENSKYSRNRFVSKEVIKRLERIYIKVLENAVQ